MSIKNSGPLPWLPEGRIVSVADRGEFFVRHHRHENPAAPILLLLHGWTASSDTQFFTAYSELAKHYSFIGIDHRGHGRGLRPTQKFSLEECADDAAAVVRALGVTSVITVGYSMGGPISLFVAQRHGDLVDGLVLQATALEWRGTARERARWVVTSAASPFLRRLTTPRLLGIALRRYVPRRSELDKFMPWMIGEIRRNDPWIVSRAGKALSKYDARPWANGLGKPAAYVFTGTDQLVHPAKQRELIAALQAHVVELNGDHFVTLSHPAEYASATREAVLHVEQRVTTNRQATP